MLLESASTECDEMRHDMDEDAQFPDMDTIYSAAFEMRRFADRLNNFADELMICLLYTSPSPRDRTRSRMPSSA